MPLESNSPDRSAQPAAPLEQDALAAPEMQKDDALVSKILSRWSSEIETLDKEKRLKLFRGQIKGHQYYDGNFNGYVDDQGEWQQQIQARNEKWYQDNQLYSYIRTGLMEMNRRQTKVQINAAYSSEETDRMAKFWQARYDANRERTFTAILKQTENVYALLNGIVYRYTYFDFNARNGRREKIPTISKRESADEGGMSETVIGYNDIKEGENKWCSPNPISIIVSMQAATIIETPFIKWKQLILRSVLEEKFKGLNLPSTGTSTELRYIGNQQTSTPADVNSPFSMNDSSNSDGADGKELELLEFQQIWLDYAVYARIKFKSECRLANGKTLKANTPMGEMFPDGLYYAMVGDLVVDIWNEDKNTKWASSPYSLRAGSMYGAGTSPAHAQQELINDLKALQMANAWNNSVPKEFVDDRFIDEISQDPAMPTRVHDIPDGGGIIGTAYAVAPPMALSAEVYGLEQNAKGSMQNQIGALSNDASGGLSDTQAAGNTATAISIRRELAVGRFAPDLELLADNLDKMQAYQFLENEQRNFTPSQWKKAAGDYDAESVKAARSCDIHRDLSISIVPDSYMPRSRAQLVADLNGYAQFKAETAQFSNPNLDAYSAEIYNVPPDIAGWAADRYEVAQLIGRFSGLAELSVEQMGGDAPSSDLDDPQILELAKRINQYSEMPVDVWLDDHQAMIDALRDWRLTDAGRNGSNALVAAVAYRLTLHRRARVKQAQMDTQDQIDAQAPAKAEQENEQIKQMQLQQGQQADAQAQNAQSSGEEKQMMVAQALNEKDEAAKNRQHEAEQASEDRTRDVLTSAIAGQAQVDAAQNKTVL